jgi:hypothetical protein
MLAASLHREWRKLERLTCSISKVALVAGGKDVLAYTTLAGALGALIPFSTPDDVEFMTTLEMVSDTGAATGLTYSTCARKTQVSLDVITSRTVATTLP